METGFRNTTRCPPFPGGGFCFILDGMLISVSMARATYLKKIAVDPEHVTPTLSMATTIDHLFSISVALLGGVIWLKLGYQYVFVFGALIAVANFFSVLKIKIPSGAIKGKNRAPADFA